MSRNKGGKKGVNQADPKVTDERVLNEGTSPSKIKPVTVEVKNQSCDTASIATQVKSSRIADMSEYVAKHIVPLVTLVAAVAGLIFTWLNYSHSVEQDKLKGHREYDIKLYEKELVSYSELCESAAKIATSDDAKDAASHIKKWNELYLSRIGFSKNSFVATAARLFNDELNRQLRGNEFSKTELYAYAFALSESCRMAIDISYLDKIDKYVKQKEVLSSFNPANQLTVIDVSAVDLASAFDNDINGSLLKYHRPRGEAHSDAYINIKGIVETVKRDKDVVLKGTGTHRIILRPRFLLPCKIGDTVASSGWARIYNKDEKTLIIECEGVLPRK